MSDNKIKYTIVDDFDHIFDEKGNTFLSLRKLYWGTDNKDEIDESKVRLDIRRWYTNADGSESVGKGVSFITEQGPHNLTKVLIDNGYGDTKDILNGVKDRKDFRVSLNSILGEDDEHYDENVEDEELYVPDEDLFDY